MKMKQENNSSEDVNSEIKTNLSLEEKKELFKERLTAVRKEDIPYTSPDVSLDCEGLSHYLMKGIVNQFEEEKSPEIRQINLNQEHEPYTCYKVWEPAATWVREESGFWSSVHFFVHLENGLYISTNGCGPVRKFKSYKTMLEKDGFPRGYLTEDYEVVYDIDLAVIGESTICSIEMDLL